MFLVPHSPIAKLKQSIRKNYDLKNTMRQSLQVGRNHSIYLFFHSQMTITIPLLNLTPIFIKGEGKYYS